MEKILNEISSFVWGLPLLILLFGTHIYLTFRLGFIQKHIFRAIRISLTKTNEGDGDISHFGSLMTALAATIGTGNSNRSLPPPFKNWVIIKSRS